jgi:hypothetical protein
MTRARYRLSGLPCAWVSVMPSRMRQAPAYNRQVVSIIDQGTSVTSYMYTASVPVFQQLLGSLDAILAKAEKYVAARNIEPTALTQSRLFPDMFPLTRQVQIACDFARGISTQLSGTQVAKFAGESKTLPELRALIAHTLTAIGALQAAQFDGSETREVVLHPGTPTERRLSGEAYLLHYGMTQFVFHITTAYALLRHGGLEIGKRDFLGKF